MDHFEIKKYKVYKIPWVLELPGKLCHIEENRCVSVPIFEKKTLAQTIFCRVQSVSQKNAIIQSVSKQHVKKFHAKSVVSFSYQISLTDVPVVPIHAEIYHYRGAILLLLNLDYLISSEVRPKIITKFIILPISIY